MVANHWFCQVEKIMEAMEITSNATKIKLVAFQLVAFQLDGESQVWWDCVKALRDLEETTWEKFREHFVGKFFPASA